MADKYYAYSRFDTKTNEWGRVEESIMPGDEITQAKLGVNDDDWAEYIRLGVVSVVPHPQDLGDGETPGERWASEDAALNAGRLDENEAKAVKARQEMQAKVANDVQAEATALASAGDNEGSAKVIEKAASTEAKPAG